MYTFFHLSCWHSVSASDLTALVFSRGSFSCIVFSLLLSPVWSLVCLWNFFYLQLGFLEWPSGSFFFSFRNSISFYFSPGQCVKLSLAFPDNKFVLQKGLFYFLLPQLKFKSCLKNFPVSYFVLFMFCIQYHIKIL